MFCCDVSVAPAANEALRQTVQARLDNLTKPPGSLGRLEELVMQYCLCRGSADAQMSHPLLCVFAADHGITAQGVCPYPREVTLQMVANMVGGGAAVTVMCTAAGVDYRIIDMGCGGEVADHPLLLSRSIGRGTADFSTGCAMTLQQCREAFDAGGNLAAELPCDCAAVGEMGIGNTSSAAALCALLLNATGAQAAGAGTGASGELLERKRRVIDRAVAMHRAQWDGTALDALARVGGFEIAGMTGYILGCAHRRIPVVIDGFIATAAALCAVRMHPAVITYLIFGHVSDEQFHRALLEHCGARALLDLGMRLGEGTGAVLALQIVRQALTCYHSMATFTSAGVSQHDG